MAVSEDKMREAFAKWNEDRRIGPTHKEVWEAAWKAALTQQPENEPMATLFHLDGADYSEESAQDVAEYHGDNMPLNSSELVSVNRFHQLPSRYMRITVDAGGHMEWEWAPFPKPPVDGGE